MHNTVRQSYALTAAINAELVDKGLVIPRCHRILPASVALWNKCKGPIDQMSRFLFNNHTTQNKVRAIGSMWLKMLRIAVYNAYQVHTMMQTKNYLLDKTCDSWSKFNRYRSKYKQTEGGSFKCFIGNLLDEIGDFLASSKVVFNVIADRDDDNVKDGLREYNRRISYFSITELRKKRRKNPTDHLQVRINENSKTVQKRCLWCCCSTSVDPNTTHCRHGYKTTIQCSVCEVPLCQVKRNNRDSTCFEEWHTATSLNNPCSHHEQWTVPFRDCTNNQENNCNNNKRRRKSV